MGLGLWLDRLPGSVDVRSVRLRGLQKGTGPVNWPSATPRPHISAALQHLRFGIGAAAVVLALCLVGQVLVWSFVHFTDVRVTQLEAEPQKEQFDVVRRAQPSRTTVGTISGVTSGASVGESGNRAATEQPATQPRPIQAESVDPNRVESASDRKLRQASALVQTLGIISAVLLLILMLQGVVVAGGGGVPGVEMAVTATTWAIVLVLLCVPLNNLIPATPFQGVFSGYDTLVAQSEGYRTKRVDAPGFIGLYGSNLVLPLLLLAGIAAAVLRFRAGVERGVIATSVSEAHERIEREIRSRKNLGEMANSRAMGALSTTVFDPLTGMPVGPVPDPAQAVHPSAAIPPGAQARPILDPTHGNYGRPL